MWGGVEKYLEDIVENYVSGEIEEKVTYAQIGTGSRIGSADGS